MTVFAVVIGGWLGLNIAFLGLSVVAAWLRRDQPVHPDVHEMLDTLDVTEVKGYRSP